MHKWCSMKSWRSPNTCLVHNRLCMLLLRCAQPWCVGAIRWAIELAGFHCAVLHTRLISVVAWSSLALKLSNPSAHSFHQAKWPITTLTATAIHGQAATNKNNGFPPFTKSGKRKSNGMQCASWSAGCSAIFVSALAWYHSDIEWQKERKRQTR